MKRLLPALALVAVALAAASCGGGSSSSSPTAPSQQTPPPPAANRAPVISAMSVSPQFGIQSLTLFTFSTSASDPDGDSLTYAWDIAGNAMSGSSQTGTFANGFNGTATITVSDGKGGTATDSRSFIVGTASGNWTGSGQGVGNFSMNLTQSAGFVTGTYQDSFGSGQVDPAQPGTINSGGQIEMRVKQGRFTDWTLRGTLSQTGRQINGQMFGSGFTGQAFVLNK